MATQLASVNERSTAFVTFSFSDNAGAFVPLSIVWSLLDGQGNIVGTRQDVVVTPPAASVTITLSDDDLVCANGRDADRYVLVEATYTSADGVKPVTAGAEFKVIHLTGL